MMDGRALNVQANGTAIQRPAGRKRWAVALIAAALSFGAVGTSRADDFFDWLGEVHNPNTAPYVTAPTLDDANAAGVNNFLNQQAALGKPLAVKIRDGAILSPSTIQLIFNNPSRPVKYIFADYETGNPVTRTATLRSSLNGTATGNALTAGTSFLGNYAISPIASDPTRPTGNTGFVATDFRNSGVNMANESLYPGDPSFRNPSQLGGTSTAPNIRSALFTLPVTRLTLVTSAMGAGQLHVPYVSRFNATNNTAFDTDPTQNGVQFDTSKNATVAGQLLSRNDFQALVLHYRMRGANSYHLLDPGVVGYTQAQEQQDAQAGWNNSLVAGVLSGQNGRTWNLGNTININGTIQTIEQAGVVASAVTNDGTSGPGLAILVSNLDGVAKTVVFNNRINGATLSTTVSIGAGAHTILRFTKSGTLWGTPLNDPSFNDPTLGSRDGVGIPEPASVSILAIGAMGVLMRRRRRQA